MRNIFSGVALLSASAWVGGMWAVGYVVAPILFQTLPDKVMAGVLAGKLFTAVAYVGITCGVYLLAFYYARHGSKLMGVTAARVVLLMLLLTVIGQFFLQPLMFELKQLALPLNVMESHLADRFRILHGASSLLFLLQSLLGALLLFKHPKATT